jgi:hypothetical protein
MCESFARERSLGTLHFRERRTTLPYPDRDYFTVDEKPRRTKTMRSSSIRTRLTLARERPAIEIETPTGSRPLRECRGPSRARDSVGKDFQALGRDVKSEAVSPLPSTPLRRSLSNNELSLIFQAAKTGWFVCWDHLRGHEAAVNVCSAPRPTVVAFFDDSCGLVVASGATLRCGAAVWLTVAC